MPLPTDKTGKLYYLASPYSHKDKRIMEYRYFMVAAAAAELYMRGYNLLEPIGSGHPLAIRYDLPQGYEYWKRRDELMIERSDGVIVLTIDGYDVSKGVNAEIDHAISLGKPVWHLSPAEIGLPLEIIARYQAPLYVQMPEERVTGAVQDMAKTAMSLPETARVMSEAQFVRTLGAESAGILEAVGPSIETSATVTGAPTFDQLRRARQILNNPGQPSDPAALNDDELTA